MNLLNKLSIDTLRSWIFSACGCNIEYCIKPGVLVSGNFEEINETPEKPYGAYITSHFPIALYDGDIYRGCDDRFYLLAGHNGTFDENGYLSFDTVNYGRLKVHSRDSSKRVTLFPNYSDMVDRIRRIGQRSDLLKLIFEHGIKGTEEILRNAMPLGGNSIEPVMNELIKSIEGLSVRYSVQYYVGSENSPQDGEFTEIPDNALGAIVQAQFPTINSKGEFQVASKPLNIYLGKRCCITEILPKIDNDFLRKFDKNYEILANTLKSYQKDGIEEVVVTERGVIPIKGVCYVCNTYEDMAALLENVRANGEFLAECFEKGIETAYNNADAQNNPETAISNRRI